MIKANYPQMIKIICNVTHLSEEEIKRKILEKKSKLSDLISKEGAAQIVAAEMGVDFDGQKIKIEELMSGMRKASLTAKILRTFPPREFKTKKGFDGKVMNMFIADDTGSTKCVLWDINAIKLFEEGKIKDGDFVEILNATVRENNQNLEVHLGSLSEIKLSSNKIENVLERKSSPEIKLAMLSEGADAQVKAVIVQVFEPRFFNVCPECKRKVNPEGEKFVCATHGAVIPLEKSLLNLTLDDGTANVRAVCFNGVITKLFKIEENEIKDLIPEKRNSLLGKEFRFIGRGRKNQLYDNIEFLINDIEEINIDNLIEKLNSN